MNRRAVDHWAALIVRTNGEVELHPYPVEGAVRITEYDRVYVLRRDQLFSLYSQARALF